jgi:hypothetical protein
VPRNLPESIVQRDGSHGVTNGAADGRAFKGTIDDSAHGDANPDPNGSTVRVPHRDTHDCSHYKPNGCTHPFTHNIADRCPHLAAHGDTNGNANSSPYCKADIHAHGGANTHSYRFAYAITHRVADPRTHGEPFGGSNQSPDRCTLSQSNRHSDEITHGVAISVSNGNTHAWANGEANSGAHVSTIRLALVLLSDIRTLVCISNTLAHSSQPLGRHHHHWRPASPEPCRPSRCVQSGKLSKADACYPLSMGSFPSLSIDLFIYPWLVGCYCLRVYPTPPRLFSKHSFFLLLSIPPPPHHHHSTYP